jgi:hypothetical protein
MVLTELTGEMARTAKTEPQDRLAQQELKETPVISVGNKLLGEFN